MYISPLTKLALLPAPEPPGEADWLADGLKVERIGGTSTCWIPFFAWIWALILAAAAAVKCQPDPKNKHLELTCSSGRIRRAQSRRIWGWAAGSSSKWTPTTSWLLHCGGRSRASVESRCALWLRLLLVEAGALDCTSLGVIHLECTSKI
jgi:hypothetical protein